jgi:hypothetical protein
MILRGSRRAGNTVPAFELGTQWSGLPADPIRLAARQQSAEYGGRSVFGWGSDHVDQTPRKSASLQLFHDQDNLALHKVLLHSLSASDASVSGRVLAAWGFASPVVTSSVIVSFSVFDVPS